MNYFEEYVIMNNNFKIKILDSNDPSRFRVPVDLNFIENEDKNETYLTVTVENSTDYSRAFIEVKNQAGRIL